MPFVRISTREKLAAELRAKISDAIQTSIETELKAPKDDKFQIFSAHGDDFIFDSSFMKIQRSNAFMIIQVFLKKGRSVEMKKEFYAKLCERLVAHGLRKEDIFISLCENEAADWSFGEGRAQLVE